MKIHCEGCGTGYEAAEGRPITDVRCPKCDSSPTSYLPYAGTVVSPAPPRPETRIPETIGRYRILGKAGQGGMGVVYRAHHDELDRTVAVKVIIAGEHAGEETIQRFQREVRAAARLSHPNIVPVFDVGQEGPLYYFVMEFVEGRSLDSLMQEKRFAPAEAARIVRDVSRALDYAHREGIVHRDVKPGNVLMDRRGSPRLVDFGLAKSVGGETKITRTGEIVGTACYMSPEQAGGGRNGVDTQSDLYSLGTVLYEMLTGKPPFTGDSIVAILRAVEEGHPVNPSRLDRSIPRDLETICLKAMAKEKPRRYASAAELADDLDAFLDGRPIRARRSGVVYRSSRWARRHPRLTTALVMLLAGLLVGSFAFFRGRERILDAKGKGYEEARRKLAEARPRFLEAQNLYRMARSFRRPEDRLRRRETLQRAVAELDRALLLYPEYAEALHLRGNVLALLARPLAALTDLSRALELDPNLSDARYDRVMLRLRILEDKFARGSMLIGRRSDELLRRDRELVRRDIESLERLGLQEEKAKVARARFWIAFDEPGDPLLLADAAIAKNPTFADAYVLRAQIHRQRALLMQPPDPDLLGRALEDCSVAVDYDASHADAYRLRAEIHLRGNRTKEALADLEEMISISPDQAQVYLDRALVLEQAPDPAPWRDSIRRDLDHAVRLDPRNPTARFFRAIHLLETPSAPETGAALQEAREDLRETLRVEPGFLSAHVFLLVCNKALRDAEAYRKDLEDFRRAFSDLAPKRLTDLELSVDTLAGLFQGRSSRVPETIRKRFEEGFRLLTAKDFDAAEARMRDVVRECEACPDFSGNPDLRWYRNAAWYNLACSRALRGDPETAIPALEEALRGGYNRFDHMEKDSDLDSLRGDARYRELLERYRKTK